MSKHKRGDEKATACELVHEKKVKISATAEVAALEAMKPINTTGECRVALYDTKELRARLGGDSNAVDDLLERAQWTVAEMQMWSATTKVLLPKYYRMIAVPDKRISTVIADTATAPDPIRDGSTLEPMTRTTSKKSMNALIPKDQHGFRASTLLNFFNAHDELEAKRKAAREEAESAEEAKAHCFFLKHNCVLPKEFLTRQRVLVIFRLMASRRYRYIFDNPDATLRQLDRLNIKPKPGNVDNTDNNSDNDDNKDNKDNDNTPETLTRYVEYALRSIMSDMDLDSLPHRNCMYDTFGPKNQPEPQDVSLASKPLYANNKDDTKDHNKDMKETNDKKLEADKLDAMRDFYWKQLSDVQSLTPLERIQIVDALNTTNLPSSIRAELLVCAVNGCERAKDDIICLHSGDVLRQVRSSDQGCEPSAWDVAKSAYSDLEGKVTQKQMRYVAHLAARHEGIYRAIYESKQSDSYFGQFARDKVYQRYGKELAGLLPNQCFESSQKTAADKRVSYAANPHGPFNGRVLVWDTIDAEFKRTAVVQQQPIPPSTVYQIMYAPSGSMPVPCDASLIESVPEHVWSKYYGGWTKASKEKPK